MIRSIAFIHTVALLVERFRPRFQAELPQQRRFHMLDESVLQDLVRDGPSLAHLAEPLAQRAGKPVFASPEWMVRDVVARVAAAA